MNFPPFVLEYLHRFEVTNNLRKSIQEQIKPHRQRIDLLKPDVIRWIKETFPDRQVPIELENHAQFGAPGAFSVTEKQRTETLTEQCLAQLLAQYFIEIQPQSNKDIIKERAVDCARFVFVNRPTVPTERLERVYGKKKTGKRHKPIVIPY